MLSLEFCIYYSHNDQRTSDRRLMEETRKKASYEWEGEMIRGKEVGWARARRNARKGKESDDASFRVATG